MQNGHVLWNAAVALAAFLVVGVAYEYGFVAAFATWLFASAILLIFRPE